MSLRINNNISAINGHRNLLANTKAVATSLQRLSSGLRINTAADDAAGLVISEQMRAQITGLDQAISNSETAVSMVQTAEGALDELNNLLNKARSLALHAANEGSNDFNQLLADQAELDNVIQSIDRIADFTQFGTKKLLDGSLTGAIDLESGLDRIRVGNLLNNPAIEFGNARVLVTSALQESNILVGGPTDSTAYVFDSAVTGMNLGAATVNPQVDISLTIDGKAYGYRTTTAESAATVAANLTAMTSEDGYQVTYDSGSGGYRVSHIDSGNVDFTAALNFSRDETIATAGQSYQYASTLSTTSDDANADLNAAIAIFTGVTSLSDVNGSSTVNNNVDFTLSVNSATGYTGAPIVVNSNVGESLSQVLARVQSGLNTAGVGFSGASLSFLSQGSGSFDILLDRGDNSLTDPFTFSLEIDHNNIQDGTTQIVGERLGGAANISTGSSVADATFLNPTKAAAVTGAALVGTSYLNAGSNLKFTIDDQVIIVSGDTTMDTAASLVQTTLNNMSGIYSKFQVVFAPSGTNLTGLGTAGAFDDATGEVGAATFYVSAGADSSTPFSFDLQVDQAVGFDANATDDPVVTGAASNATLNVDSITGQVIQTGQTTATGHLGVTIGNDVGATININGRDASATMATRDGSTLHLVQDTVSTTGAVHMILDDDNLQNAGFEGVEVDIDGDLAANGGSRTFTLTLGAAFQVGPNAEQRVFETIDDAHADELGRNISTAVTSIGDLSSTRKGALINGLTDDAIRVIDAAVDQVTTLRGRLGAFQSNALESGLSSLRVSKENLTSSESTIRDADFASESSEFTKNNILTQSATAMLAQANQLPQNVLQLLQ